MKDKWTRLQIKHNPAEIVNYNPGSGNVSADLIRAARPVNHVEKKKNGVYVNGRPLCEFSVDNNPPGKYDFDKVTSIRHFFASELLRDMPSGEKKEANIDYLMEHFHQGGFLFPVSAAMDKPIKAAGYIMDNNTRGQLSQFVSTPNGFTVQEYFVAPNLKALEEKDIKKTTEFVGGLRHAYIVETGKTDFSSENFETLYKTCDDDAKKRLLQAYDKAIKSGGNIIGDLANRDEIIESTRWRIELDASNERDQDKEYSSTNMIDLLSEYTKSPDLMASLDENPVINAVATLDINLNHVRQVWDESGKKMTQAAPRITVTDSVVQYGNEDVRKRLDKRNLGQRIVDYFKNLFGMASVKDISPEVKDLKLSLQNKEALAEVHEDPPPPTSPRI